MAVKNFRYALVSALVVTACSNHPPGSEQADAPPFPVDTDAPITLSDGALPDAMEPPPAPLNFAFTGAPQLMCDGLYQPPSLLLAPNRMVVGCLGTGLYPSSVKFMTLESAALGQGTLLTSSINGYQQVRLTEAGNKFQAITSYACEDDRSYRVGQGWSCLSIREFSETGDTLWNWQFGQDGHNGHPVLASATSGELQAAWVSYDSIYTRNIPTNRTQVGAANTSLRVGVDPTHSDARDSARSQIIADANGYAIFTMIGARLYFSRIEGNQPVVAMKDVGIVYGDTRLELAVVGHGGNYYLAYNSATSVRIAKLNHDGDVVQSATIINEPRQPQLLAAADRFYVLSQDGNGNAELTTLDLNLNVLASGLLGGAPGRFMYAPTLANVGNDWVVAYSDRRGLGSGFIQRLTPMQ